MLCKMIQDQKAKSRVYPNTPIGDFHRTMDRLERDLYFECAAQHACVQRYNRIKRSTGNAPTHHQTNKGTPKEHD